jgi:probable F420-dependent oxidoreductase
MQPMRFGVNFTPHSRIGDPRRMVGMAAFLEELGFNHISLGEHFLVPSETVDTLDPCWYDNFALAGAIGAVTRRLRVVFAVVLMPLHHPIQLAKSVATVDCLTGGRLTLGVGLGWVKADFDAMGIPFSERAARTEDYLKACKALWSGDTHSYEGRFVSFRDVVFQPQPLQKPHPPIWMGGAADVSVRRAARFGDGYQAFGGPFSRMQELAAQMRVELEKVGRDPDKFDYAFTYDLGEAMSLHLTQAGAKGGNMILGPEPARAIDQIAEAQRSGFNHLTIRTFGRDESEIRDRLQHFSEEVMRPIGAFIPTPA